MGVLREDGSEKPAAAAFPRYTPEMGICQWFHFEDHRLDDAVRWLRRLGVRHLRTGLSWADSFRTGALAWLDRKSVVAGKMVSVRVESGGRRTIQNKKNKN